MPRTCSADHLNSRAQRMYSAKKATAATLVRVGVGVLIREADDKILLEKRADSGFWGLPGGRPEAGETIHQTVTREIMEETGLTVEVMRLLGVYSDPEYHIVHFLDNGDERHLIDIIVEARIISGELRCSHESEKLAFFSVDEIPQDLVPSTVPILEDLFKNAFDQRAVLR